jgi:PAS domain S-box-containing protein
MKYDDGRVESMCPEKRILRVLLAEDDPTDAQLCLRLLRKSLPDVRCDVASTRDAFVERLRNATFDVILADYALGNWTGMDALNLVHNQNKDIPFILVTGALGDQRAVECVKSGMADYVLKDRLDRLPAAISGALNEKSKREILQRERQLLEDSEAQFRALAETTPAATFIEQGTRCCYVNPAAERITGYSRKELLRNVFWSLLLPDSRKLLMEQTVRQSDAEEGSSRCFVEILTKTNQVTQLDVTVGTFHLKGKLAALITAFDIAGRKNTPENARYLLDDDPAEGRVA